MLDNFSSNRKKKMILGWESRSVMGLLAFSPLKDIAFETDWC
jgi:hypothetical protein